MATTIPERMARLAVANDVRQRRAQLRRDLRAREVTLTGVLADPPEWLLTANVAVVLLMVPWLGAARVQRGVRAAGVLPASESVGSLTDRQRDLLVEWLDGR